jgi:hypothetical protein
LSPTFRHHLKHNPEVRVQAVNVATTPNDGTRYVKRRDELWFAGRSWLDEGGALPPDAELHGELTAARFTFDPRGRYAVESKDDMKKRLKRSPNKADAFNLAVSADAAPALDQATADDFADLMPRVE